LKLLKTPFSRQKAGLLIDVIGGGELAPETSYRHPSCPAPKAVASDSIMLVVMRC
jgi:hypothetical protein